MNNFFMLLMVLAMVAYLAHLLLRQRRRNRFLEQLQALPGWGEGLERSVTVDGVQVRLAYVPGERGRSGQFTMGIQRHAPVSLRVERRNGLDRLLDRGAWVKPIVSGDSHFDANFKIISDHPGYASGCFQNAARREAVRTLFGLGCHHLVFDAEGVRAEWHSFAFDRDRNVGFIEAALPVMLPLSAYLPQAVAENPGWLTEERFKAILILAAAAWVVAALALTLAHDGDPSLDPGPLILLSLKLSLPLLAMAVMLVGALVRGRSWSARGLGLFAAGALVAFTLSGYGIAAWLNCHWDTTRARSRRVEVLDREVRKFKRGRREYRLSLRSWRPGQERELLTVSDTVYRQVEAGPGQVTVVTRPGWLGCEWLVELDP